MDPFLTRLLIAVGVYFFFDLIIKRLVTNPDSQSKFETLLLICCLVFVVFGKFLPF